MMKCSGAELIVKALEDEGVDTIFTLHAFFIMDILYSLKRSKIKIITCRNELSAALAADGYARSSGKTGFLLVNTGPSCLNTVMAIKTSQKDGIPVVMLVGTDVHQRRNNETFFQVVAFPKNITPHTYVLGENDIYQDVRNYCNLAKVNPISPVVLEVPLNVSKGLFYPKSTNLPPIFENHGLRIDENNEPFFDHFIDALNQSEKPLVIIGAGILQAKAESLLRQFLEKFNIPAVTTFCARGILDEEHSLFVGMPGIIGNIESNQALNDCDLMIALGTRLSSRFISGLSVKGKLIYQVNCNSADFRFDLSVIPLKWDVFHFLSLLLMKKNIQIKSPWRENSFKYYRISNNENWGLTLALASLLELTSNATVFCDDGTYTVRLWQMAKVRRPRGLLFSGNMASGGHALPGGLGAKLANHEDKVVVITGDGGLLSIIGELQVYAEHQLGVLIVVFNNNSYDSINQWSNSYDIQIDSSINNVDFSLIAKGFNLESNKITNVEAFRDCIMNYKWDRPLVIELIVPSENVECHFPRYTQKNSTEGVLSTALKRMDEFSCVNKEMQFHEFSQT